MSLQDRWRSFSDIGDDVLAANALATFIWRRCREMEEEQFNDRLQMTISDLLQHKPRKRSWTVPALLYDTQHRYSVIFGTHTPDISLRDRYVIGGHRVSRDELLELRRELLARTHSKEFASTRLFPGWVLRCFGIDPGYCTIQRSKFSPYPTGLDDEWRNPNYCLMYRKEEEFEDPQEFILPQQYSQETGANYNSTATALCEAPRTESPAPPAYSRDPVPQVTESLNNLQMSHDTSEQASIEAPTAMLDTEAAEDRSEQRSSEPPASVVQSLETSSTQGLISLEKHDTVVAALKAEIRLLRENEERLLSLGLAWKKERDELLKNAAQVA